MMRAPPHGQRGWLRPTGELTSANMDALLEFALVCRKNVRVYEATLMIGGAPFYGGFTIAKALSETTSCYLHVVLSIGTL